MGLGSARPLRLKDMLEHAPRRRVVGLPPAMRLGVVERVSMCLSRRRAVLVWPLSHTGLTMGLMSSTPISATERLAMRLQSTLRCLVQSSRELVRPLLALVRQFLRRAAISSPAASAKVLPASPACASPLWDRGPWPRLQVAVALFPRQLERHVGGAAETDLGHLAAPRIAQHPLFAVAVDPQMQACAVVVPAVFCVLTCNAVSRSRALVVASTLSLCRGLSPPLPVLLSVLASGDTRWDAMRQ